MSWDCIVIGGGCAGLAAATLLAENHKKVLVLEQRPLLGGRASSWHDRESGETIDNGQHLFLGCYEETQKYLKRVGSAHHLNFWNSFSTPMIGPDGQQAHLNTWHLPAPWHLAMGLLNFRALSFRERMATFRVASALKGKSENLSGKSVAQWLDELKQSPRSRSRLWDLLTLATLNISPEEAPAQLLAVVLQNGFMASKAASRIGLSSVGLSDLHGEPSRRFIESQHGEVRLRTRANRVKFNSNGMKEVILPGGVREETPWLVMAVPPPAFRKLSMGSRLETSAKATQALKPSSIVSVHAWFDRVPFAQPMVGFWDQSYHWAFRKDLITQDVSNRHVSLVTSSAASMLEVSKQDLKARAETELRKSLIQPDLTASRVVVVREREATWIPPVEDDRARLSTQTKEPGVFLAGDWTATGLPATIEGAVKSGHLAAEAVLAR